MKSEGGQTKKSIRRLGKITREIFQKNKSAILLVLFEVWAVPLVIAIVFTTGTKYDCNSFYDGDQI